LEAAKAGVDYIDTAIEPLAWGTSHPDVITIQTMLKDAGFKVPEINMNAYMQARALTQEFMDDFLGHFINPKNHLMSSLLIGSGLPGGMMGSLMADLECVHQGINQSLSMAGKPTMSLDDLLVALFDEVKYVWPKLGYPPLVTPFSQYVKNIALMNLMSQMQGKDRWQMIDKNAWDMILGKAGKLPGPLAPEILELAEKQKLEFYQGVPQDAYPDALDGFRKEMIENGWELGENEEELFEFAMHERQYRDYKSGEAKARFNDELNKQIQCSITASSAVKLKGVEDVLEIKIPEKGRFYYDLNFGSGFNIPQKGEQIKAGQRIGYIESQHGYSEVLSLIDGKVHDVLFQQAGVVDENTTVLLIEKN
ncbi:MAG: oxaloacetate decarboxylase, partial [Bacteroidales bacterium]|nr:oxaloacetate decarboxylase [Bacteroidales bacterium]